MTFLDWALVAVVLAYALSGYWQGFITGACATAGLLLGGLLGIWLAPVLLGDAESSLWVSLGALFVVILSASVGQGIMQYAGALLRDRITWQPARAVDAVGGAALSAVAVLLVAWALGLAVSNARISGITPAVRGSVVLQQVNDVLPRSATGVLQAFTNVVGTGFFPRYLEPFAQEQIVEVGPPPGRLLRDPDVVRAGASVLKVSGENDCGRGVEGSGFLYANDLLMTNAHVVAGVDRPEVTIGDDVEAARVVFYDEDVDLAVLAVDDNDRPALRFARAAAPGDGGAVLGYPADGPYSVSAARIRDQQRLRSPDIYGDGSVVRDVYSVRGTVRPGNSGGPLVSSDGGVLGVVFAASVTDAETGYVLTAQQAGEAAAAGLASTGPVGTGGCAG